MSLRDVAFKLAYCSDEDNLLTDFYIPALKESISYDRLAGFFCSNSLAISVAGLREFLKNGGHIRLISNVVVSADDQKAMREVVEAGETKVFPETRDNASG